MRYVWLIAVAQLTDFLTFYLMVSRYTIYTEANISVAALYNEYGIFGALVGKICLIALLTACVVIVRNKSNWRNLFLVLGIGSGFIGTISNLKVML